MKIEPVTPTIGAEISGIDLFRTNDPNLIEHIYDAVIRHLALFFGDQELKPQAHFDFACAFGTPAAPHPVYPHLPGFDRVVLLEYCDFCIIPGGYNSPAHRPSSSTLLRKSSSTQ